jgi:hypothetical protein
LAWGLLGSHQVVVYPTLLRVAAVSALLLALDAEALAFCRTTTCKCTSSDGASTDHPEKGPCPNDCPREKWCQTTGTPVAWAGKCVGFSMNIAGTSSLTSDQWGDAIVQAFLAWGAVDCGHGTHPTINLQELRPVACAKSAYNPDGPNVNVVYFEDTGWEGKDLDSTYATTKVHFEPSGEIVDADIAINSARFDVGVGSAGGPDLVSILTHEVGHFLGLDHSADENAVMFYSLGRSEKKRSLQQDDIDAICTLYPPDRTASCDPTPHGGFGDSCEDKKVAGCSAAPAEAAMGSFGPALVVVVGGIGARFRKSGRRWRNR